MIILSRAERGNCVTGKLLGIVDILAKIAQERPNLRLIIFTHGRAIRINDVSTFQQNLRTSRLSNFQLVGCLILSLADTINRQPGLVAPDAVFDLIGAYRDLGKTTCQPNKIFTPEQLAPYLSQPDYMAAQVKKLASMVDLPGRPCAEEVLPELEAIRPHLSRACSPSQIESLLIVLRRVVRRWPSEEIRFAVHNIYIVLKDILRAQRAFDLLAQLYISLTFVCSRQRVAEYREKAGNEFIRLEDRKNAATQFEEAFDVTSDQANFIRAKIKRGDFAINNYLDCHMRLEAAAVAEKVARLADLWPRKQAIYWRKAARIYRNLREFARAAFCFENAALLDPDPKEAYDRWLGALVCYRDIGNKKKEARCLKNLARIDNDVERAIDRLIKASKIYMEFGEYNEVGFCLEKAAEMERRIEGKVKLLIAAAEACSRGGKKPKGVAIRLIKKAQRFDTFDPGTIKKLEEIIKALRLRQNPELPFVNFAESDLST